MSSPRSTDLSGACPRCSRYPSRRRPRRGVRSNGFRALHRIFAVVLSVYLAGCTTFHALPLDASREPRQIADIDVPAESIPTPTLGQHVFNPEDGLDVTEVAMLAISNNPQLKLQRDAAGIAYAEAYAAGLLPDPNASYEHDRPVGSGPPGTTDSYTASLSLDVGNLVTRRARVKSALAHRREVDLDLLWSEWQTIAQARTLFDRVYFLRKLTARLARERQALAPLQSAIKRELDAGNLTYAVASIGLDSASAAVLQLGDAERQLHLAEQDLHILLGLDASVPLRLTGAPFTANPDHAQVEHALATMPQRRPDLLALKAGYQAENDKLRAAILAQFPAITVGFVRARDNSNINSAGLSIGLSLPLFDGNRGNIAVERATRRRLHDAYSERLLTDRNDVHRLAADLASDRARHATLAEHAAELARARVAARTGFATGQLDWATYLAIRSDSLAADTALLTLEENTHATGIALDALTGNWPDAALVRHGESRP